MSTIDNSAAAKLSQSKLSDQLELLKDDVDLSSLNLAVKGRASLQIVEAVTGATVSRTILGASTLTVTMEDRDNSILASGIFGTDLTLLQHDTSLLKTGVAFSRPVDTKIDGLWFRLVNLQLDPTSPVLTLTFEDREVAILRGYPRPGDPNTYKAFAATAFKRAQVMLWLIQEPQRDGVLKIPYHFGRSITANGNVDNPVVNDPTAPQTQGSKDIQRKPGFPPGVKLTVKNAAAKPSQVANIAAVLDAGEAIPAVAALPKLLVVAVMVITQESVAGLDVGSLSGAVGLFQQNPLWWPGTGNPAVDATAFYEKAIAANVKYPSASLGLLASEIQRPLAFLDGSDPTGVAYGQWETEATRTVAEYLGSDILAESGQTGPGGAFSIPAGPVIDGNAAQFVRGQVKVIGGKKIAVRENNWAALQRLASEVGWRVFCVSGRIYIGTDDDFFRSRVRMVLDRDTDGVDGIGLSIDTAKSAAQAAVNCRVSRWQCPPGTVAQLRNVGPANGRWLVQTISRDLFKTAATVTLSKPQPVLSDAETPSPVEASGLIIGEGAGAVGGGASGVVAAARKALAQRGNYAYEEVRPMPSSLFLSNPLVLPLHIDCSAFVTLCYKAAGLPDPNRLGYNGQGFTGTLFNSGTPTDKPQPGDLIFYGTDANAPPAPQHVGVYLGLVSPPLKAQVIEIGSAAGIQQLDYDYRTDLRGYRTYA